MRLVTLICAFLMVACSLFVLEVEGLIDPVRLPAAVNDTDYYYEGMPSAEKVELGRLLFFDKILSGNQNISCATCHHPSLASTDGVALAFGEGAAGLGQSRKQGRTIKEKIHERLPRNAPGLFNLGAKEFDKLFHDGRVEVDTMGYYEGGFITPARWKLPVGLDNVLAAQAMFPVTSPSEMAGQKGENSIADARALNNVAGPGGVWEQLAERLQSIPEYVILFQQAYPEKVQQKEDISMVLAANAIAAFETVTFRSDKSPFDTFLRTGTGLQPAEKHGMELFYGKAGCFTCHSGPFQTDQQFHAIAMPQIGPGKSDGNDPGYWRASGHKAFVEDFGRGRVTDNEEDNYKFRTPSLRNVAETGPWGHSGAYATMEAVVRHHLDPIRALENYQLEPALLPRIESIVEIELDGPRLLYNELSETSLQDYLKRDTWVQNDPELRRRIATANELKPVNLIDAEVEALLAFLGSLTDAGSLNLEWLIPQHVPSGLPVVD